MFIQELEYFIANQAMLVSKFGGKVLVIKGEEVIGVYDDMLEAYRETQKVYKPGTFMLQRCLPGPEAYTEMIGSQVFA